MLKRVLAIALRSVHIAALISLLQGCDTRNVYSLRPGESTGYEVRLKMGEPTMEWRERDGSTVLEFSRMPSGYENYMARIGQDNILLEIKQVLTPQNMARVKEGMSKDSVRRLLGKPATIEEFPLRKEQAWSWPSRAPTDNTRASFTVYFGEKNTVSSSSFNDNSGR